MRQGGLPSETTVGLTGYFSRVTHPCQIEMLGKITVEILRQDRRLTRTAVCLKLIGWLDSTDDISEAAHLRELIAMLFGR